MKKNLTLGLIFISGLIAAIGSSAIAGQEEDRRRAFKAYVNNDYDTALRLFSPLAEQGHAESQYWLGLMYADGKGVPQNFNETARLHKLSAEQGDFLAQLYLGGLYESGTGVEQNDKTAVYWYRSSAGLGQIRAMPLLANMIKQGRGTSQDFIKAHMWYNIASIYREDSVALRDELARQMSASQLAAAQDLAKKCHASKYKDCD